MKIIRTTLRWLLSVGGAYIFVSFVNATFWIFITNGTLQFKLLDWLSFLGTYLVDQIVWAAKIYPLLAALMIAAVWLAVYTPTKIFMWFKAFAYSGVIGMWISLTVQATLVPYIRFGVWSIFVVQIWIFFSIYWSKNWEAYKEPYTKSQIFKTFNVWLGFEPEVPGSNDEAETPESAEVREGQNPGKHKHDESDDTVQDPPKTWSGH